MESSMFYTYFTLKVFISEQNITKKTCYTKCKQTIMNIDM